MIDEVNRWREIIQNSNVGMVEAIISNDLRKFVSYTEIDHKEDQNKEWLENTQCTINSTLITMPQSCNKKLKIDFQGNFVDLFNPVGRNNFS